MRSAERGPIDPPIDAAIKYLRTGEHPSDPKLGKVVDGLFVPGPKVETQTSAPQIGAIRRFLRITGLT